MRRATGEGSDTTHLLVVDEAVRVLVGFPVLERPVSHDLPRECYMHLLEIGHRGDDDDLARVRIPGNVYLEANYVRKLVEQSRGAQCTEWNSRNAQLRRELTKNSLGPNPQNFSIVRSLTNQHQ